MVDASGKRPDQQSIDRIRDGDRQAFEHLFRKYYKDLCRFALDYVNHLRIAEDFVQDVFFDLWKERRTLETECSLKAYLYGMTRHRALKHLRREQTRERWTESGDLQKSAPRRVPDQPGEVFEQQEQKREVKQAIEALPKRRRRIFMLSRRHDLTYSEIAAALDISIKTVETQMSRALKFLRKQLEFSSTS